MFIVERTTLRPVLFFAHLHGLTVHVALAITESFPFVRPQRNSVMVAFVEPNGVPVDVAVHVAVHVAIDVAVEVTIDDTVARAHKVVGRGLGV